MSNVLIGIIGVILFIGLALAGALILGDEFRSSRTETKAASIMQSLSQMTAAANMFSLKTGAPYWSETITPTSTIVGRFLKTPPSDPLGRTSMFHYVEAAGGVNHYPATTAVFLIGRSDDEQARTLCEAIERQTGQLHDGDPFVVGPGTLEYATLPAMSGCQSTGINLYAFSKI